MFGTLVLELPSVYEGAELSVWSPLTPNEKMTYTFNGGSGGGGGGGEENSGDTGSPSSKRQKKKNKNRKKNKKNENTNESTLPGLHFAAFYADCYHEVSKLTSGHRVALVYHLTATPLTTRLLPHLPAVPSRPSQPAEESIAIQLAKAIDAFGREGDEAYPSTWSDYVVKQVGSIGKPKKLAVVLSHSYTPASLTGIQSLKGSDRAIAELIRAAAYRSPDNGDVVSDGEPVFDAVVALAVVWDWGEGTPTACSWSEKDDESTFYTTGPIISILASSISKGGNKENVGIVPPLNLGPALVNDREAAYHPSWFGGQEKLGPPYQFEGPFGWEGPEYDTDGPIIYGEQACQTLKVGNHSLPIYSHEILFASEEAAIKFRKDGNDHRIHTIVESDPKEIEFRK